MNTIKVLQRLDKEPSVNVYLVGGFVRDFLRGEKNDDLDVVVKGMTIKKLKAFLSKYGKVKLVELSKVKDSFAVKILLFSASNNKTEINRTLYFISSSTMCLAINSQYIFSAIECRRIAAGT